MNDYECEECGADMRSEYDESGTGNLTRNGWLCDECLMELDEHDEGNES
jgi:hypothetical protein